MVHRAAAGLISVCLLSPCAIAAEPPLGCYINTYDDVHMAKHKGQTITSIKLNLTDPRKIENSNAVMLAGFEVTLLGQSAVKWGDEAFCNGKAGNWKCQIECDGGGFEMSEDASGLTLFNTRGFRITRDGGCGEVTDFVEAKPGNRTFRLAKSNQSACK